MADHLYDQIIEAARRDIEMRHLPDMAVAEDRLQNLRDYGEFALLGDLAELYLSHAPDAPKPRKLYAQALIDTGRPNAALGLLHATLDRLDPRDGQYNDLTGILGRAHKDLFLAATATRAKAMAAAHAQASFSAYHRAYRALRDAGKPGRYYPGINALALAHLANEEGIALTGLPGQNALGDDILAAIDAAGPADPWAEATRAEVYIARQDWSRAEASLGRYLGARDVTLFQLGGTLRQFRDVWRLARRGARGRALLGLLKAGVLDAGRRSSGLQYVSVSGGGPELPDTIAQDSLEKVLGQDGFQTYQWLRDGFSRAESVAAVLTRAQHRIGTAFAIDPVTFGLPAARPGPVCLMTNYHVLNKDGAGRGLSLNDRPKIRFEGRQDGAAGRIYRVGEILFESQYGADGLDCTIFTIDADGLDVAPVPIDPDALPGLEETPRPRVYVIGHPRGGEMQFSLQDNRLLDHEGGANGNPPVPERVRLHYFAPTEPGNSGSPVFDDCWNCIALHHAGLKHDPKADKLGMPRLNDLEGYYSANEGIWIGSIIAAIARANAG